MGRALFEKFYELAVGDFSRLMLPDTIVICEGNLNGKKRRDFDKSIYEIIFSSTYPNVYFISGGGCEDIENFEENHGMLMNTLLKQTKVIKVGDRDYRCAGEIQELNNKNIKVLKERNLESYLLDDEIINKLCEIERRPDLYGECIKIKQDKIQASINRNNAPDDYKSARGEIYTVWRTLFQWTNKGNTADNFLKYVMAPLGAKDTEVYKRLEAEIFG